MTFLQKIQKSLDMLKQAKPSTMTKETMEMLNNLPGATARMAITVISILPLLICYPFFQKYFVKGLTIGSVKG